MLSADLPHKINNLFAVMSNKRCAPFTQNCTGAKFLRNQFCLFDQDPSKGLDPSIVKPKEIRDIYHRFAEFHPYSLGSFPTNYKTHATLYLINKDKERSESECKRRKSGKLCYLYYFIYLIHQLTPKIKDEITGERERCPTPEKKLRVVSFKDKEKEGNGNEEEEEESSKGSIDLLAIGDFTSPASTTTEFSYENITLQQAEEAAAIAAKGGDQEQGVLSLSKGVEELSMKSKTPSPPVWKAGLPYMITSWKDSNDRDLITIEIHLPSGSIPEDVDMKLVRKGPSKQYLALHYRVSDVFLSHGFFDEMIGQFNLVEAKDASALSLARASTVLNLRKTFTDKTDLDKKYVHMHKEIALPMICEDIFTNNNYQGYYPNCSELFRNIPCEDENGEVTEVLVLIVTLVGAKVEDLEVTRRNTPNRTNPDPMMARARRGMMY